MHYKTRSSFLSDWLCRLSVDEAVAHISLATVHLRVFQHEAMRLHSHHNILQFDVEVCLHYILHLLR